MGGEPEARVLRARVRVVDQLARIYGSAGAVALPLRRRLDTCYDTPRAAALHATFMAEAEREPDLFTLVRGQGNKPRCEEFLRTLRHLQDTGAVRADADLDATVTLCHGSYFGDYLRSGQHTPPDLVDRIVALLWPVLCADGRAKSRPAGGGPGHW
ncbi:TetR-like C-terminal domain-containing protein [Streptomyces alboflavus]|uniref:TetR-like C-terminal domain-containing protein n=1 Tax=Streptomyces alboflavus TaxID=67267 RepID=UPI0023D964EB|nr:TetR-like C-terminal domain-containing protein [Streptomyces alboflavus]